MLAKGKKPFAAIGRLLLVSLILLAFSACPPRSAPTLPPSSVESQFEIWECRNDLEVTCGEGTCAAQPEGEFTPMRVHVETSGRMSVCAYSGCWEGEGEVFQRQEFLVLLGHDLKFSTAQNTESAQEDIAITIDRGDKVATFKAGAFSHPMLCEQIETTQVRQRLHRQSLVGP